MTAFRPFTKEDWYGMAGATPFEDDSEPLVCYDIKVDGLDTLAVIDAEGFHFEVYAPDGDQTEWIVRASSSFWTLLCIGAIAHPIIMGSSICPDL